jgi:hypothetical protein
MQAAGMIRNEDDILGFISNALEHLSSILDAEQAVRGIDSLTEDALRDCIRQSLAASGIHAVHEARYPDAHRIQQRNYGDRCDLVLLPHGASLEQDYADSYRTGYWLEIKRVAQFLESGPNWWYEHALLEMIPDDVYKLAKDSEIFYAGVLLILFTATQESGRHGLAEWKRRAIAKGCPVGVPRIRQFEIANRLGNEHACVALFPVRRL